MALLDHEAIYEAYKSEAKPVVSIDDTAGAFDADGNSVTLDQSKIDAARTSLNAAAAAVKYQTDRKGGTGLKKQELIMMKSVINWICSIRTCLLVN